jgi:RNA 2',3'-cyclic 3'-phosphodiesterase
VPRLFLALDPDERARAALACLTADLPGARWVTPAQIHVTLRFLGSVSDADVARVRGALAAADAFAAVDPFDLVPAGVGVFPPRPSARKPPRVLWAGVTPAAAVQALKQAVDGALDPVLGPDVESAAHGFYPHLTLARFKAPPGPALADYLQRHADLRAPAFRVDRFNLYESRTLPAGPAYTVLERYGLGRRP